MKLPSEWDLMKRGQFELAYAQMTEDIAREPKLLLRHGYNRGLCLLNLKKPELALLDFQKLVELRPNSDSGYIGAGMAYWWLNQKTDAVQVWERATNSNYTDAAGGVIVPALLFFAASRLHDMNLEKGSIKVLKKRYKTKRASAWPGPIAGFLLGKITETDLLEKAYQRPALQARMLTQAHFWIGTAYLRQNNTERFRNHLYQSHIGSIIEPEYYLAKHELQSIDA